MRRVYKNFGINQNGHWYIFERSVDNVDFYFYFFFFSFQAL